MPDTSEGMGRQQPMTAVLQLFDQDSTDQVKRTDQPYNTQPRSSVAGPFFLPDVIPQPPPSNHPCLLDCFPYSLCSSRCRSSLRDLCMTYLSALLSCQPTLSACSSPSATASLAVLLWTHAACARHDKVVVHKVHVVAASTPTCSDVGPHPLQLVLVVLLLGSN